MLKGALPAAGADKGRVLHCTAGATLTVGAIRAAALGLSDWSDGGPARRPDDAGLRRIVDAYRRGELPQRLAEMRGSFALALLDDDQHACLLATDRFGTFSIYYTTDAGSIAFGSEPQGLDCAPHAAFSIDLGSIFHYVYFHQIPAPLTIYAGVSKLEPATLLRFDGALSCRQYWSPAFATTAVAPLDALHTRLRTALTDAVADVIKAEDSVGCFLSGGLDSSTMAGCAVEVSTQPVKSFTIGFDQPGYDEREYAHIAATHFHTQQIDYALTPADVVATLPTLAGAYPEPFGNSSALPTYFCARLAKDESVTCMIAGDGGDELFAGNERYAKQKLFEAYYTLPANIRTGLATGRLRKSPKMRWVPLLGKLNSYIDQASVPLPERLQAYNFLHQVAPTDMFAPEFLETVDTAAPLAALEQRYSAIPQDAHFIDRMLYLDWKFTLADNDLRKVATACAFAGVDVRFPMLDARVVDLSCAIPGPAKLPGLKLRKFYKDAMTGFLPPAILNKTKHGFGLPFGLWLREYAPLKELAYDNVSALKSRGFFRHGFLDRAVAMHRQGHAAYYGELVWILTVLELWLKAHAGHKP